MADVKRPWHGQANPLESLHEWMVGEIARLEAMMKPAANPNTQVTGASPTKAFYTPQPTMQKDAINPGPMPDHTANPATQPIAKPNPPIDQEQAPHEAPGPGPQPSKPTAPKQNPPVAVENASREALQPVKPA